MIHKCALCNKEFKAKKSNRKYCSRKCFEVRNKESNKRVCLNCLKEFKSYPNWTKRGGGKFCSHKCHSMSENKKVEMGCQICDKVFKIKPSTLKHNASKYCSPECGHIASLGIEKPSIQGENHPNWRGGDSVSLYPSAFNYALKESIRKRDNYECKMCGILEDEHLLVYGSNLQIHHIDYRKISCEEDNLISLCNQCHGRTNYDRKEWTGKLRIVVKNMEGSSAPLQPKGDSIMFKRKISILVALLVLVAMCSVSYAATDLFTLKASDNQLVNIDSLGRMLGFKETIETIATNDTITAAESGKTILANYNTALGPIIFTLPTAASGLKYTFKNIAGHVTSGWGVIRLEPAATDLFNGCVSSTTVSTFAVGDALYSPGATGDSVTIIGGPLAWYCVDREGTWVDGD